MWDQWTDLHAAVGLDAEFYALRDALPTALWHRLLDNCWDHISEDDQRSVARYRDLVPSALWRKCEEKSGTPVIPDRLVRRLRSEAKRRRRVGSNGLATVQRRP